MTLPHRLAEALADRYRLERELGQGGMATVYLAQDLKHDRQVALKALTPESARRAGQSSAGSTAAHPGGRNGDQA